MHFKDSIFVNRTNATGTNSLYVVDQHNGVDLLEYPVQQARVGMKVGSPPYVVFIKTTELNNVAHACCGHAVVVKRPGWGCYRLGMVLDLRRRRTKKVLVLLWTGQTEVHPNTGIPLPTFLLLPEETSFETMESHFEKIVLNEEEDEIIFVEQVNGPRAYDPSYGALTRNEKDHCFQCTPEGSGTLFACEIQRTTEYLLAYIPKVDHSTFPGHTERRYRSPTPRKKARKNFKKRGNFPWFCCGPSQSYDDFKHPIYYTTSSPTLVDCEDELDKLHMVPFVGEDPIKRHWLPTTDGEGNAIDWDYDLLLGSHPNTMLFAHVPKVLSRHILSFYGVPVDLYNMKLFAMSVWVRRLCLIDARETGGTRMVLVDPATEGEIVLDKVDKVATKHSVIHDRTIWKSNDPFKDSNVDVGFGIVVSRVEMMPYDSSLCLTDADLFHDAYGSGMSPRDVMDHLGQSVLAGHRTGQQARPNLMCGSTDLGDYSYSRQHYNNALQGECLRILNKLIAMTQCAHFNLDPCLCEVVSYALGYEESVPMDKKKFCRVKLVTQGYVPMGSPNMRNKCWGFASTPHVDKNDMLKGKMKTRAEEYIDKQAKFESDKVSPYVDYMRRMETMFGGISVPMLCGYEYVGKFFVNTPNDECEMYLTFAFPDHGFCYRLGRSQLHQFQGGNVKHCTPIPIVVKDGKVYLHGENSGRIVAWGGGSTEKEVEMRAQMAATNEQRQELTAQARQHNMNGNINGELAAYREIARLSMPRQQQQRQKNTMKRKAKKRKCN